MKFRQQLLNYILDFAPTSQLPEIGYLALEEGYESESLVILAGMSENDNSFEITNYFQKTINELGITLPNKGEALIELGLYYAEQILNNDLEICQGTGEIIRIFLTKGNLHEESKIYAYDSIDFEMIYSIYHTIEDLQDSEHQWNKTKTNFELIEEAKIGLRSALKNWFNKYQNLNNKEL